MDKECRKFIAMLTGRRLQNFCCEAEMFDLDFGSLVLHAMGCSRVIKDNEILVTVSDYQSWDGGNSSHNDEWYNMKKFNPTIVGGTVVTAELNPWNDLRVRFDNGVTIECLIANACPHYADEQEQWVLFERTDNGRFLTVYNRSVELICGE